MLGSSNTITVAIDLLCPDDVTSEVAGDNASHSPNTHSSESNCRWTYNLKWEAGCVLLRPPDLDNMFEMRQGFFGMDKVQKGRAGEGR